MLADVPETRGIRQHVQSAIINLAYRNRFSPARDWLDSLDMGRRSGSGTCSRAGSAPRAGLRGGGGRIFMLQAACRVLAPGCKADYVPVLTGEPGEQQE